MNKFTIANYSCSFPTNALVDFDPPKGLFLWQKDGKYNKLYCLTQHFFFDTLAEAKNQIPLPASSTLFTASRKDFPFAIIEVECNQDNQIVKFSNIYEYPNFTANRIKEDSLNSFAFEIVNELYQQHRRCSLKI